METKGIRIAVRLTPALKEAIEADAKAKDMSVAQFMRWLYREWKAGQK